MIHAGRIQNSPFGCTILHSRVVNGLPAAILQRRRTIIATLAARKKANPCRSRQNEGDCLTSFANEHLDQDRLERLAKALVDEVSGTVPWLPGLSPPARARELAGDRAHADYCPGCKASVEILVAAEMRFRKMMSFVAVKNGAKTPKCPADRIWASVATGLISDREAAPWISHAAECGRCGPLLREAAEDLAGDPTPEELAQIGRLFTPEWRGKMARAMNTAASGVTTTPTVPNERRSAGWLDWLGRRAR